jgi:hypothetical protein
VSTFLLLRVTCETTQKFTSVLLNIILRSVVLNLYPFQFYGHIFARLYIYIYIYVYMYVRPDIYICIYIFFCMHNRLHARLILLGVITKMSSNCENLSVIAFLFHKYIHHTRKEYILEICVLQTYLSTILFLLLLIIIFFHSPNVFCL